MRLIVLRIRQMEYTIYNEIFYEGASRMFGGFFDFQFAMCNSLRNSHGKFKKK